MKRVIQELYLSAGKIDRRHVQILLATLILSLQVEVAGAK